MQAPAKILLVLAVLAASGCSRSADLLEARRDHILAADHGWIDVTLHAPVPASSATPASSPATHGQARGATNDSDCGVRFSIDGESVVTDSVDLAAAEAAHVPIGYRFAVPAGKLASTLSVRCNGSDVSADLPLEIAKNQVSTLEFDGKALTLVRSAFVDPASLDSLRGDLLKMQDTANTSDAVQSRLTQLVVANIALDALLVAIVLAVVFRRRRRDA